MDPGKLTFLDHLEELRRRIILSLVSVALCSVLFYFLEPLVLPHLMKPIGRAVFLSPAEAFTARLTLAFFGGVFTASPFVLLQGWLFLSSGLREKERKPLIYCVSASFLLFVAGSALGYFVFLPFAVRFLIGFGSDVLVPMISIGRYVSFAGTMVLVFGAVFQMPLVIFFLTRVGILTPAYLAARRREAIVSIFVFAAIFTPPDVMSQVLLALPMVGLYELSILFSKMNFRKR
jgi:sec-independent protein translocase protein TatC